MDPQNISRQPQQISQSTPEIPSKSYLPFIIGGLLILLLVGIGGFYLGKTSTKPSITPTPPNPQEKACTIEAKICPDGSSVGRTGPNCEFAPCPTAAQNLTVAPKLGPSINWKTYINSRNNFQIRYPADKNVLLKDTGYIGFCNIEKGEAELKVYPIGYITPAPPLVETGFCGEFIIIIAKKENTTNQTVEDWVTQNCPIFLEKDVQKEPYIINSYKGTKYISKYKETEWVGGAYEIVIFPKNKDLYFIYGSSPACNNLKGNNLEMISQIISTFKFLDEKSQ